MSIGLGLIRKIIEDKVSLSFLSGQGVTRDHFIDNEKEAFGFLTDHIIKYGKHPKRKTLEREVGVTLSAISDEPIEYWIEKVKKRSRLTLLASASKDVLSATRDGDFDEAFKTLQRAYSRLIAEAGDRKITTLAQESIKVRDVHDEHQMAGYMSGVPFGMPFLDAISDGAQASDTVAVVGRPGAGKSYFLAHMANSAYSYGATPLYAAYEMSNLQNARRLIALRTNLSATSVRLGRLSFQGKKILHDQVYELHDIGRPFYLMQGTLKSTVEDLVVAIQELKPTVLYVDGAYLLRTANTNLARWERISETAEFLKSIASEFGLPVIASYQFNRKGAGNLSNIAGADAIGQLASIVISIDDEEDDYESEGRSMGATRMKTLELLKGREGESGVLRVVYDMQRMIIKQDSIIRGVVPRGADD